MIFNKAYKKLRELYGNDAPPAILSRFYTEKSYIESSRDYDMFSVLSVFCEESRKIGEHVFIRGTYGSSFIAFLLGITSENPLYSHFYCKRCKRVVPMRMFPLDETYGKSCSEECGAMIPDGYDIPFEMHIKNLARPKANVVVSKKFFDAAGQIITNALSYKHDIISMKNDSSKIQIAFAPKIKESNDASFIEAEEVYTKYPYIIIIPSETLNFALNLEAQTGVYFENVPYKEKEVVRMLLQGDTKGIPYVSNERFIEAVRLEAPKSIYEYSKLFGAMRGINTFKGYLRLKHEWNISLKDFPAYRDDLFFDLKRALSPACVDNAGLALHLTDLVSSGEGYKNREFIKSALFDAGFSYEQIDYMMNVKYMFHKAHSMTLIKYSLIFIWYRINYPEAYEKLRLGGGG